MDPILHTKIGKDPLIDNICRIAFPTWRGRNVQVYYNETSVNLRSYWDGGSRSYYAIIRLEDGKALHAPTSHPFYNRVSGVDKFDIPEGFAVVEHCIFCGKDTGIKIHVPGGPQLLGTGTEDEPELTQVQQLVLSWLVGLTSAGRKDALSRYHFPKKLYTKVCEELEELEYCKINKAGSISKTLKAQNYFSLRGNAGINNYAQERSWEDCYSWKTRKFTGWARDVLIEYNEKYNLYSESIMDNSIQEDPIQPEYKQLDAMPETIEPEPVLKAQEAQEDNYKQSDVYRSDILPGFQEAYTPAIKPKDGRINNNLGHLPLFSNK